MKRAGYKDILFCPLLHKKRPRLKTSSPTTGDDPNSNGPNDRITPAIIHLQKFQGAHKESSALPDESDARPMPRRQAAVRHRESASLLLEYNESSLYS